MRLTLVSLAPVPTLPVVSKQTSSDPETQGPVRAMHGLPVPETPGSMLAEQTQSPPEASGPAMRLLPLAKDQRPARLLVLVPMARNSTRPSAPLMSEAPPQTASAHQLSQMCHGNWLHRQRPPLRAPRESANVRGQASPPNPAQMEHQRRT